MVCSGQWHIYNPNTSSCLVAFKIGIVVIEKGKQSRDNYRHSLSIGSSSSLEIHTKRLIIDTTVVVLIRNHLRYECSRTIILEHVPQISQRLYGFLVEHHVVYLTL